LVCYHQRSLSAISVSVTSGLAGGESRAALSAANGAMGIAYTFYVWTTTRSACGRTKTVALGNVGPGAESLSPTTGSWTCAQRKSLDSLLGRSPMPPFESQSPETFPKNICSAFGCGPRVDGSRHSNVPAKDRFQGPHPAAPTSGGSTEYLESRTAGRGSSSITCKRGATST